MIPWSIGLLTLFYGAIATLSAATLYKIMAGMSSQSLVWTLLWLICSSGAAGGLMLLKPWGRRLAILTSLLLLVATLAVAGLLAQRGHPVMGLVTAMSAALHVVILRHLRRPVVQGYFMSDAAGTPSTPRSTH